MDTLGSTGPFITAIIRRTSHRSEYASGLTSLIVLLTLIVLVRFGADIYLFFSLHADGAVFNLRQVWGSFLLMGVSYLFSTAPIQGYKLNRFLNASAAVFQPSMGRKFFSRLQARILLYRPLGIGIFTVLFCLGIIFSVLFGPVSGIFIWVYYILALGIVVGGYLLIAFISYRFRLEEFETRLVEVIILIALVFSNPDIVSPGDSLMFGFYLLPLPLDHMLIWLVVVCGTAAAAVLLLTVFRLGRGMYSNRKRGGLKLPIFVKLYERILRPRYWAILYSIAAVICINVHMETKQKLTAVLGLTGAALFSFSIFAFSLDNMTKESWYISVLKREHLLLFTIPVILHLALSAVPYILYRLIT